MAEFPLTVSQSALIDSTGRAVVSMSPTVYGTTWTVNRVVITTNSAPTEGASQFRLYRNTEQDSNLLDSTYSGDSDTSETSISVGNLETVLGVWAGGNPGATATLILYGTYDNGRGDK